MLSFEAGSTGLMDQSERTEASSELVSIRLLDFTPARKVNVIKELRTLMGQGLTMHHVPCSVDAIGKIKNVQRIAAIVSL